MSIAPELLRRIVEGALLAAAQPLSEDRLLSLIDEGERPEKAVLKEALVEIADRCSERGFDLHQVASGWRLQVSEDLAPWVNKLWEEKPQKYSRATLETLAIIAYRQPITRGDIEEIRGVSVSSYIIKSLSERAWIKVVGQRDVPGKPSLYATTREFLDYFNLKSLDNLPSLAEIRDIESLNAALDLGDTQAPKEEAPKEDTANTEDSVGEAGSEQAASSGEPSDETSDSVSGEKGSENDEEASGLVTEGYAEETPTCDSVLVDSETQYSAPTEDSDAQAQGEAELESEAELDNEATPLAEQGQKEVVEDTVVEDAAVEDTSGTQDLFETPAQAESEVLGQDEIKSPENLNS